MTGRRSIDPMMILLRVRTCHMPKEVKPSLLNNVENWITAGNVPDSSVSDMPGIRDLEDFTERPCVKSIQSPTRDLVTGQALESYRER